MDDDMNPPPKFGRIDPFCWLPVIPTVVLAIMAIFNGAALPGIGLVCLAVGVVVFDAWVNRPGRFAERREPDSRSMWSQYEDDEVVDPVPRAPAQRTHRPAGGDPPTAPTDPIRSRRRSTPSGVRNATAVAGRSASRSGW